MTVTYEQRVARIKTVDDIDDEIRRAKQYVKAMRSKEVFAESLADKLSRQEKTKQAEAVLRRLRLNMFQIEADILAQGITDER